MILRDLTPDDFAATLAINEASVPHVSSINEGELARLFSWSERALVADVDGAVAGFVITIAPDMPYGSANYRWFSERYPGIHYLDRVVVADDYRRQGIGSALYQRIEERRPVGLEVNVEPLNDVSLAFHKARDYVELEQVAHEGGPTVAMLLKH